MNKYSIANKKREKLLEKVTINKGAFEVEYKYRELFEFYGLDYYLNWENTKSILGTNLEINRSKMKIKHQHPILNYFTPEQYDVLKKMEEIGKLFIIKANTSFGKTLITLEHIFINSDIYRNVALIVPTNSLAYELEAKLKSNINFTNKWDIFDTEKSNSKTPRPSFFVGTQEKFADLDFNFDLVVIDEAYKLTDNPTTTNLRAYLLNKILYGSLNEGSKVILLTPPCKIKIDHSKLNISDNDYKYINNDFNIVSNIYKKFNEISKLSTDLSGEKTIYYVESPKDIGGVVNKITKGTINKSISSLLESIRKEFSNIESTIIDALERGILVHHGEMPKYIQDGMLNAYQNEDCLYLIGTSSIAEGINTSALNVVLNLSESFINNKILNGNKAIITKLRNVIGRAGRMGVYPIGRIYGTLSKNDFDDYLKYNVPTLTLNSTEKESGDYKNDEKNKIISDKYPDKTNREAVRDILSKEKISLSYYENLKEVLDGKLISKGSNIIIEIWKKLQLKNKNNWYVFSKFKIGEIDSLKVLNTLFSVSFKKYCFVQDANGKNIKFENDSHEKRVRIVSMKLNFPHKKEIWDKYFLFRYSFINHDLVRIAKMAKTIINEDSELKEKRDILKKINLFFNEYHSNFLKLPYLENLSVDGRLIINKMIEYGIDFSIYQKDDVELLMNNIEKKLNSRFSMYDIKNAMISLKESDSKVQIIDEIFEKYFFDF